MAKQKLTVLLVFILTAIFYVCTMLPSLAWGDGTKLQSEAVSGESFVLAEMPADQFTPDLYIFSKVGVAAWDHPLYIMLGYTLFKTFPFVDSLWLVNLVSAIFGAGSVALLFLLVVRFTNTLLAACYASLSLAVSHTFWWHSSTPEVYTLFIFLLLASFYFFDQFESTGKQYTLFLSAFFLGLSASTHVMGFLVIPALALYYLFSGSLRFFRISLLRKLILPVVAFVVGFSPYTIQFIRMSANFPLNEIMGPVVGSTFLRHLATFSVVQLGLSLLSYLFFLTVQFGPVGLILGGFGIRRIYKNRDYTQRKIIIAFIVFALFGIIYRVTDQFTFFITSYIFWAMFMGLGSDYALSLLSGKRRFLFSSLLGLTLLATPFIYVALPPIAESVGVNDETIGIPKIGTGIRDGLAYYMNPYKRGDDSAYRFGAQTISSLPPDAVVLAEWYTDTDEYFILRYFTKIELLRPDVKVVGWANQDPFSFDSQLALDEINGSFPERPVYLASLSEKFYAASTLVEMYCVIPENNLYRLNPKEDNAHGCLGDDSVTE